MQISHGGNSRTAKVRRRRAAVLSQRMHYGDSGAALSLLQRRRGLVGIAKLGAHWRVMLMNQARLAKRKQQLRARAVAAERQRQQAQSTVRLDDRALAALRARYGRGGFTGEYREGECRPVIPGVACPACGWKWGNRESHPIAVP